MGHGDARSEEPDQSNVNSEPEQADYVHGGAETSLDLRKLDGTEEEWREGSTGV